MTISAHVYTDELSGNSVSISNIIEPTAHTFLQVDLPEGVEKRRGYGIGHYYIGKEGSDRAFDIKATEDGYALSTVQMTDGKMEFVHIPLDHVRVLGKPPAQIRLKMPRAEFHRSIAEALDHTTADGFIAKGGAKEIFDIANLTIREIRDSTGLTQAAFSQVYGIPQRTLENWERRNSLPVYTRMMLAEIVGMIKLEE